VWLFCIKCNSEELLRVSELILTPNVNNVTGTCDFRRYFRSLHRTQYWIVVLKYCPACRNSQCSWNFSYRYNITSSICHSLLESNCELLYKGSALGCSHQFNRRTFTDITNGVIFIIKLLFDTINGKLILLQNTSKQWF
jgi:hypothetical protein